MRYTWPEAAPPMLLPSRRGLMPMRYDILLLIVSLLTPRRYRADYLYTHIRRAIA